MLLTTGIRTKSIKAASSIYIQNDHRDYDVFEVNDTQSVLRLKYICSRYNTENRLPFKLNIGKMYVV